MSSVLVVFDEGVELSPSSWIAGRREAFVSHVQN